MEHPVKPEPNSLFTEFEQFVHAKFGSVIEACMELVQIGNDLFGIPVAEPVQKVIRFLTDRSELERSDNHACRPRIWT